MKKNLKIEQALKNEKNKVIEESVDPPLCLKLAI
jgi:hypothetical protein